LKQENHSLNQKRIDLETLLNEYKTEVHALQTQVRHAEQQTEMYKREADTMKQESIKLENDLESLRHSSLQDKHQFKE
jgi:chromosome segregation ATPase